MTATTPKGIPYPQNGIDYIVDAAEQIEAVAESVDALLDDYRLLNIGGLVSTTAVLEEDTDPVGTSEAAVLTSEQFVLSEPTQVQLTLSWDALTADTAGALAQFRLRPGNLGATGVGGCRVRCSGTGPDGGGSITACPTLPAGTYTILATLQLSAGSAVLNASQEAPMTLLVRPLP